MKTDYSEENLKKIVSESKSIRGCLKKLNLTIGGNNDKTLKKYLNKFKISIGHFKMWDSQGKNFLKKTSISEILVEDSQFSRGHLKERLFKEGFKKRECEICGQGEIWKGKKMSLILDHVNGVNNDNRIENLRIVCSNCNATLDTHCGKNNKIERKKYYCKCGKEKYKDSKMCKECSAKLKRKVQRPKIGQLKKEIEELGYVGTGKKHGVSDNAVRKWITKYNEVNKKKCPVCGEEIWLSADMCKKCSYKKRIKRPLKEVFEKEIGEIGISGVAEKYSVTERTVYKWIKHYEKNKVL